MPHQWRLVAVGRLPAGIPAASRVATRLAAGIPAGRRPTATSLHWCGIDAATHRDWYGRNAAAIFNGYGAYAATAAVSYRCGTESAAAVPYRYGANARTAAILTVHLAEYGRWCWWRGAVV